MITIDEFKKTEIRIGEILAAEKVPDTDKLLRLSVAIGDVDPTTGERVSRQIVSGIAQHFPDPQSLVGKKCAFVTNLEPRTIRGLESRGMILAVKTDDGKFSLLETSADISSGALVG